MLQITSGSCIQSTIHQINALKSQVNEENAQLQTRHWSDKQI